MVHICEVQSLMQEIGSHDIFFIVSPGKLSRSAVKAFPFFPQSFHFIIQNHSAVSHCSECGLCCNSASLRKTSKGTTRS